MNIVSLDGPIRDGPVGFPPAVCSFFHSFILSFFLFFSTLTELFEIIPRTWLVQTVGGHNIGNCMILSSK